MFAKNQRYNLLLSLGLIVGVATGTAVAQISEPTSPPTEESRRADRSTSSKIAVTLGGLALIGAELWWFQFSKTKARQAEVKQGVQEIEIAVDGGYSPNQIVVIACQPVRLSFFRKDPSSCLEKVILPDFHRAVDLHLHQTTPVEFTPEQPGEYSFHCGMNMFRGTVVVREQTADDRTAPKVSSNGQVRADSEK